MSKSEKQADPAADRRKKLRYVIGPDFPVNAMVALCDETGPTSGGVWKDWPGTLVDVSAAGAHIQVNLAAVAYPENRCRLRLTLGRYKLEIPGMVAHFVCNSRFAVCGIQFDFTSPGVEKAYARFLEPVVIGATLAPIEGESDSSGRHREQYRGNNSATLAVWRESAGGEVSGFDFQMGRYGAEADRAGKAGRPALKLRLTDAPRAAPGEPQMPLMEAQEEEARWQFRLAVGNLSKSVPADVRGFLQSLAVA